MDELLALKRRHDELYKEVLQDRSSLLEDREQFNRFDKEVTGLLSDMTGLSSHVDSITDYAWLRDAVSEWRVVFSSIFTIPRDIRLSPPSQQLAPPSAEESRLSERYLESWVRNRAYELSRDRRLNRLLTQTMEQLLRMVPSSREETEGDWHEAGIDVACEVLYGTIDFVRQVGPESYWRLETQCWLAEVKRATAYSIWEGRGGGWDPRRAMGDYYAACDKIRGRLLDTHIKASQTDFEPLKGYIEDRYLTNGKITESKSPAQELIAAKAKRLSEADRRESALENWLRAKTYVAGFYENIIPAVMNDRGENVRRVMDAFKSCGTGESRDLIINCFETAIAIYFLKSEAIQGACGDVSKIF
ncbi:MAG: hypothetical protein ABSF71_26285 [Terriglobia bacterium]|jgi:hypothetical protein